MPQWIHTESYVIEYGWVYRDKSNKGFFSSVHKENIFLLETEGEQLRSKMHEFHRYVTEKQLEIKSTTPITTSLVGYNAVYTQGNGAYGYGYGYGVSQVVGMLVLLQRIDEVSNEEYQKRMETREVESLLPRLQQARDKALAQVNTDKQIDFSVSEKKKLLGGYKYVVNKQEFDSKDLAERHAQSLKEYSIIHSEQLKKAENALQHAESRLKLLQNK